jgi:nicotinamide mononucleotide transporter
MLDAAFTLWSTAVTWLEVVAFLLALLNIVCNALEIHWGWPLSVLASALYAWLFYASGLYGEAGVNVFFALTALWGWWQWLRGHRRAGDAAPLAVVRLARAAWPRWLLAQALLWLLCAAALARWTDSTVPWADGFVTAGSVLGTVLLGRKYLENWPVWLMVNAASVALFFYKGLLLTVLLYLIFLVLAWWGWRRWQQHLA